MLTPLNSTMLAVGLPAIRSHFDVGVGEMTLLISVYLVAVAAMQPVSGRLGDAFGSIRVMIAGLVLLIAISAVSALAFNLPMLILMRGLQGAATSLVLPNGIAVLRRRTPSERLGTVLGMNGAALSIAAALGPVLGGGAAAGRRLALALPRERTALGGRDRVPPADQAGRGAGAGDAGYRRALAGSAGGGLRKRRSNRQRHARREPGVPHPGRGAPPADDGGLLAASRAGAGASSSSASSGRRTSGPRQAARRSRTS